MAVTRTGTEVLIQNGNQSWSQNITVPADAEICIVLVSVWKEATDWIPANPFTLGGSNLTTVQKGDNQSANEQGWIGYILVSSTGTVALACNWGTGLGAGACVHAVFYKGIDTDDPIKSSGKQTTSGADLTGLTASAGDMMVGCVASEAVPDSVNDNSQTEIDISSQYSYAAIGTAEKDGGTGFYFTGGTYTSVVALVLAQAGEAPPAATLSGRKTLLGVGL